MKYIYCFVTKVEQLEKEKKRMERPGQKGQEAQEKEAEAEHHKNYSYSLKNKFSNLHNDSQILTCTLILKLAHSFSKMIILEIIHIHLFGVRGGGRSCQLGSRLRA